MTTTTKESPTYSERMEAFPDVNEELAKYTEAQQKNWALYLKVMKALNMGRTHHVRTNSWDTPEKVRADGTPFTKTTRASRVAVSRRRSKVARASRKLNR